MLTRGVEFAAHLWRTSFAKDQFWSEFAEFLADGMSVGIASHKPTSGPEPTLGIACRTTGVSAYGTRESM
jgi:hypothetical protein